MLKTLDQPKGARAKIGRPRGARNKKTLAVLAAVEAGGPMPLDYVLSIMRDENEDIELRLRAAIAAAPYCHAKLASIQVTGSLNASTSHDEWVKRFG